jgi:hypothetical protein
MVAYARKRLLSTDRYVEALLEVRAHNGEKILEVGGCWDTHFRCFVDRPCKPQVVTLEESQYECGKAFARWLEAARRGEPKRTRCIVGGGNRGSGKTYLLGGIAIVAVALAFPNEVQFGVNLTTKQKRECLDAIRDVARAEWIKNDVADFRDPRTVFITGCVVEWLSGQNPKAIRQAGRPIRYVLINEGQDQPERVFVNCIAAIRNTGGLVGIATNPPQAEGGDWTAALWLAIDAGEVNGEKYLLDNKLNRSIDQDAVADIGAFIRAVNPDAARADVDGEFKLSGLLAYPAFSPLPVERGGHIGEPPEIGWRDVTREETAKVVGGAVGFDFVVGADFQKDPGIVGDVGKLYRDEKGELVLAILDVIYARGVEGDFTHALLAAGYSTNGFLPDGKQAPSVLIVGDGTGARQNAEHRFHMPPSFAALRADGWKVVPPMLHYKTRVAWNPAVRESRNQMHALLSARRILFSERCKVGSEGFPSLVESMRRAKVTPKGKLVEKGGYQHAPDGVRYLAWRFMPRPKPPMDIAPDESMISELRSVRVLTREV